jgi:hypothetical protein
MNNILKTLSLVADFMNNILNMGSPVAEPANSLPNILSAVAESVNNPQNRVSAVAESMNNILGMKSAVTESIFNIHDTKSAAAENANDIRGMKSGIPADAPEISRVWNDMYPNGSPGRATEQWPHATSFRCAAGIFCFHLTILTCAQYNRNKFGSTGSNGNVCRSAHTQNHTACGARRAAV